MFDFTDSKNLGKEYNGFILLSIDDIPDYKTKGVFLRHKRTGLEVYHMLKDDKENLFAFAFRTLSKDSKGTAHIMEHSVLCGSEKYPLKEPFNTLASTSLNTFLNALTYPDKTVYPGASVVRDDYFNMMDVYADAVFFPKLDHFTFLQEGHRLEMDDDGKLSIQGVVYNEMKANYSSFEQIAFSGLIKTMFPNSFPSFDSGGDPLNIPDLTYQQFCDFHQKFYNPDNCILFLYGDIPTADQLDFLNERFISRIEKKYNCTKDVENYNSKLPLITPEIKELQNLEMRTESGLFRFEAPETGATGNFVTVNWYSGINDMEKYYLSEVLSGNDSSPLNKALKESGLGDELCNGNFGQFTQEFFSAGLWGVKKENENKVFDLVNKTIQEIYKNGVSQNDIDAAVMGIDFALREVNRYWGPFSIQIMEKVLKGWARGDACASQLTPITAFEVVKEKIRTDKDYTRKLIKKYFIDNKVVINYVAEPTSTFFTKRNKSEEDLITKLEKNLDKKQLKQDLDELHNYQQHIETPEETKCIPSTKLSSLDNKIDIFNTELEFVKGADGNDVPLFVSKEDTNGIFYIDVLFPFDHLEPKYYEHLPVLQNILCDMGWSGKKWDECISESACAMGGAWGSIYYGTTSTSPESKAFAKKYEQYNFIGRNWIAISSKAIIDKAEKTFEILSQMIKEMNFDDEKRFDSIVQELKSNITSSFVQQGLDYAGHRVCANWNSNQALCEILFGLSGIKTINSYNKKNYKERLELLKNIYFDCLKGGGIIHITADEDSLKKIKPLISKFAVNTNITKLVPAANYTLDDYKPYILQYDDINSKDTQLLEIECQTGFAAAVSPCSNSLTKEAAAELIYTTWLTNHSLWDKIRTTGGAYGSRVYIDAIENKMSFMSWRDPTPQKSIEVYLDVLKEYSQKQISKEDIEKTIVSCYGDAIVPVCPKDRGHKSFDGFIYANPMEFRKIRVDKFLTVTPEDVQEAAKRVYEFALQRFQSAIFSDKKETNYGKKINIPL